MMKKLIYLFVLMTFVLGSCCNNSNTESDQTEAPGTEMSDVEATNNEADRDGDITKITPAEGEDVSEYGEFSLKDCDEFLDEYETWANEYMNLLERFKSNPASPRIAQDYNKLSKEYITWTNDWLEFVECTKVEGYQKRYNEINKKIEQKQAELQGV